MSELYENIMKLCQLEGITGGKLCGDLGFSRSMLSDLKSGRITSLSTARLEKIAEYFDVSVDELLGRDTGLNARDKLDISRRLALYIRKLEMEGGKGRG